MNDFAQVLFVRKLKFCAQLKTIITSDLIKSASLHVLLTPKMFHRRLQSILFKAQLRVEELLLKAKLNVLAYKSHI